MRMPHFIRSGWLLFVCILIFFNSCSRDPLHGLQYRRIDAETVLISQGFPYQDRFEVTYGEELRRVKVKEIVNGVFQFDGVAPLGYHDAVGMTWVFTRPGQTFTSGAHAYTSKREGATITFQRDGVLVSGFEIRPRSN